MTSWGRSFYNNFLSIPAIIVMVLMSGELGKLSDTLAVTTGAGKFLVFLSCLMGLGISMSGFVCRAAISATSFSVVGNMNKVSSPFPLFTDSQVLTIFINYVAWDYHASPTGLGFLCICVVGGMYYAKVR
jgi:hypothetical protein